MSNTINSGMSIANIMSEIAGQSAGEAAGSAAGSAAGIGGGTNISGELAQAQSLMASGNPDQALQGQKLQDAAEEQEAAAATAEQFRHKEIMDILQKTQP